jgi:hypothetical protein
MQKFLYFFLFAIVFLMLKAFYLDDYIAEYKSSDINTSSEINQSFAENNFSSKENSRISAEKYYYIQKKMPLDQLGERIAEKIEDKF